MSSGDSDEGLQLHVTINAGAAYARLQQSLQRLTDCVSFGRHALDSTHTMPRGTPGAFVSFSPAANRGFSSVESARDETGLWILSNGFRDAIESVAFFLEGVREVGEYMLLPHGSKISLDEIQARVSSGARAFHMAGLPGKVEQLRERLGARILPDSTVYVLSLNSCRNCLVHRNGVVGEKDVDEDGTLLVRWEEMQGWLEWPGGRKRADHGVVVEHDETHLVMRAAEESRAFSLGETVRFGPDDFVQICWFLTRYAQSVTENVRALGEELGLPPSDKSDEPSRGNA